MEKLETGSDNNISPKAYAAAAEELGCGVSDIQVVGVDGGYSRNRRSLAGYDNRWIFVKEVDLDLLPNDGTEELGWLRKDYECATAMKDKAPESVPEWAKLTTNNHVLLLPSYRKQDGWLWSIPTSAAEQKTYIQAVINATKRFEGIKFTSGEIDSLGLQPYFRDELALDGGLELIIQNTNVKNSYVTNTLR